MRRIAFWLYQVYVFVIFMPLGLILTFMAGWLTVGAATVWNPRVASRYVAANWARLICWMTPLAVEIEGAENADPERTYVVVCNHQSQYDIFLVYGYLKLDLKWVLKAELRKAPGVGIGCEKAGHIFVDRSNPEQAKKAVSDALDSVGNGVGVLFFAEGTRSMDGRLRPFKKGAFRLAAMQGLPILPVTIIGTRDIQKPKSLFIFPGRVKMVIHPPIEVSKNGAAADVTDLVTRTRSAIASALPEELR
jgi:1-acyl-sn-glycerol-3-phosphate acyltransferase